MRHNFGPFYEIEDNPKLPLMQTISETELMRLREIEEAARLVGCAFYLKESECQFNSSACPDCVWLKVCDSMPKLAQALLAKP